jgi:hypothetical protein
MDRYDAILEQLKQVRSRGLESVTGRLDALVETLGELIESTKSTAQSALPSDAEDIFPLSDVESLVEELRREEIEREEAQKREEAQRREEAEEREAEAAPAAGISLDNLRTLDGARSQSELLRALLPLLAEHVGRVVVLVIRDGVVTAWSGIGFPDGENLRSWHGGVAASPDFQRLVDTAKPIAFTPRTDPLISQWLPGDAIPDEAVLLPISLRGKLMGMVYLDHDGDQPWNVEAAQSLNAVTCWLIDTLHHRTVVPTPMLAEIEVVQPPFEDAVPSDVFEAPTELEEIEAQVQGAIEEPAEPESYEAPPASEPEPEPQPHEEPPEILEFEAAAEEEIEIVSETFSDQMQETGEGPAQEQVEEEIADIDYDFEPEPVAAEETSPEAGFDPSATVRVEASEGIESPEYAAEADNFPISRVIEAPPEEPPPEELPETPPPIRPIEPPAEPAEPVVSSEDDARQEEARRFARLLVSEIKLYNEDEVERGRVERDLGERLKDDIERSREMYEKRIPAEVRSGRDYFQDELVRILADGDADAFGG